MKKIKAIVVVLLLLVIGSNEVYAACSFEEMNILDNLAHNVSVTSNLEEEELTGGYTLPDGMTEEEAENYKPTVSYFNIIITNLTEDLYVVVYNDVDGDSNTYRYEDSNNGVINIKYNNLHEITNFKITVHSANSSCLGESLYTQNLVTPMYNEYSSLGVCQNNKDFYLCYDFLEVDNVDYSEFIRQLNQYIEGKIDETGNDIEENKEEKKSFFKEHKGLIIIVTIGILGVGISATMIVAKKQGSKVK